MASNIKEVKIKLDETSVSILKELDPLFYDVAINVALRYFKESETFKVFKGDIDEKTTSLSSIKNIKDEPKNTPPIEENNTSWDDF